ncbi:Uncharacterized protein TPAR_01161, partial [Tolypocladium paradoxum]
RPTTCLVPQSPDGPEQAFFSRRDATVFLISLCLSQIRTERVEHPWNAKLCRSFAPIEPCSRDSNICYWPIDRAPSHSTSTARHKGRTDCVTNTSRHVFPAPAPDCSRQAHRPADPRRAQGLLRQRANVSVMAQLHRHPRRAGHWHAQLRRPRGLHLGLSLHGCRHVDHDICAGDVSLAREVDTDQGPGRLRRPVRPDLPGHHSLVGRRGQLCPPHHGPVQEAEERLGAGAQRWALGQSGAIGTDEGTRTTCGVQASPRVMEHQGILAVFNGGLCALGIDRMKCH